MEIDDLFEAVTIAGETDGVSTVLIRLHVQPGAGRSMVVGRHGTALKLRVAAPPVEGRANQACAELLAETFAISVSQVELVGGQTSRSKSFRLTGLDFEAFKKDLERVVSGDRPGSNPRSPNRT